MCVAEDDFSPVRWIEQLWRTMFHNCQICTEAVVMARVAWSGTWTPQWEEKSLVGVYARESYLCVCSAATKRAPHANAHADVFTGRGARAEANRCVPEIGALVCEPATFAAKQSPCNLSALA